LRSRPSKETSGAKFQKKGAAADVFAKTVRRASKLKETGADDYALRRHRCNGVEDISSILRRKCDAGGIAFMELLQNCLFFGFNILSLNIKISLKAQGERVPMLHLDKIGSFIIMGTENNFSGFPIMRPIHPNICMRINSDFEESPES
jgi:hypothetical protein